MSEQINNNIIISKNNKVLDYILLLNALVYFINIECNSYKFSFVIERLSQLESIKQFGEIYLTYISINLFIIAKNNQFISKNNLSNIIVESYITCHA